MHLQVQRVSTVQIAYKNAKGKGDQKKAIQVQVQVQVQIQR